MPIVLSNVVATPSGLTIIVTATSDGDLSTNRFGAEFGPGGGAVYTLSRNVVGQVANQSITIGLSGEIYLGVWSVRPYYNLTELDPPSSRVYGAAKVVTVDGSSGGVTASGGGDSSRLIRRRQAWIKAWKKWKTPVLEEMPAASPAVNERREATIEVVKTLDNVDAYLQSRYIEYDAALVMLQEMEKKVALTIVDSRLRKLTKEAARHLEALAREEEEEVNELINIL